jgi:DNA-binding SARP family transcriptional activator
VSTLIRLLGDPAIEVDGQARPVRGHQAWAVLARILLTRRDLDRRTLAAEIFSDTADPLGSLRWSLAALRRALDCATCLWNDPIEINFPDDVKVDVWDLEKGVLVDLTAGRLLNGLEPRSGAEFETWLLVERERLAALTEQALRDATFTALSTGLFADAIRLSELGVRLSPLDERAHILLVRSLASAGRHDGALAQVKLVEKLFFEELGEKPSPALRSAARRTISSAPAGVSASVFVRSLIDAGLSALSAGASDAGIDCLRRAVHEADKIADGALQARAALELGTALVHAVRGQDDEGAILLHRATELATVAGDQRISTTAFRELGYVEALAGRRPAAATYLGKALAGAEDPEALAGIHSVIAFNLVDWGRCELALEHYAIALDMARESGSIRREIWTLGMGAWGLLEQNRCQEAENWLNRCLELVDGERWVAFRPWPIALLAECRTRRRTSHSSIDLERAYALSCQLGDPCWEGVVARAIGLRALSEEDLQSAFQWFSVGYRKSMRETDGYSALQVKLLGNRAETSRLLDPGELADDLARQWVALAARHHMDTEVSRAALFLSGSVG